jgi:hypothetical protein
MITSIFKYCFIFLFFISANAFAQISGTKTIGGTNPDYATFSAAAVALNTNGINGPVVFNVAPGTYNEQFELSSIVGSNSVNTITFQSSTGIRTSVVLQIVSTALDTSNYVVKLNGTDYISFKHMTFQRTGANLNSRVFQVSDTSYNVSFYDNIIKNDVSGIGLINGTLIYSPNNRAINHEYIGNLFENGDVAIYNFGGGNTLLTSGTKIKNNTFMNQGHYAIFLKYQDAVEVSGNIITSSTSPASYMALNGMYLENHFLFIGNKISINQGQALYLALCNGHTPKGLIANNFINISNNNATGINLINSQNQHIYFNSINLIGQSTIGISFNNPPASNNNRVRNNIVKVDAGSFCVHIYNSNSLPTSMDYNNFYPASGGYIGSFSGTSYSTINSWQTATSTDANSISVNPNFTSASDLHIANLNTVMTGTSSNTSPSPIVDIDGDLRSTVTPNIGADEYTITDISLDSLHIDTQMCLGNSYSMVIDFKNTGSTIYNAQLPVVYQFGTSSAIQIGYVNIQNLAPGAVYSYTPTQQATANPIGVHKLRMKIITQNDANQGNDSISFFVTVHDYPMSNLPNDTTVCGGKTVVLDPGAGYDSYLWFDGTTTQTYTVDSTGIGYGGKFIAVNITDNGCSIEDSTLVLFKNCVGIDNAIINASLRVYPNPVTYYLYIDNQSNININHIEIIRVDGQLVRTIADYKTTKINVSDLSKGIYYLRIQSEQKTIVKKFVKE